MRWAGRIVCVKSHRTPKENGTSTSAISTHPIIVLTLNLGTLPELRDELAYVAPHLTLWLGQDLDGGP